MNDDIEITMSPLCQTIQSDGVNVQIDIYTDGNDGWILEVIDGENNSIVWDDSFPTDEAALKEALDEIHKEGITALSKSAPSAMH